MTGPVTRLNSALEGRYRIESELGEGGMANVYLADDLKHERKVALKVLKPELAAVVGAERFLAEIKTTANLQHPHILPLFDSGEADSFLFYVMPFVEGETLRDRIDREHQLPVDDAVQIAKNVAEALDYAHKQGVIHRDIKPANILLQAGKPVVSDFGIALAVGAAGGGRLTETGLSLGTPHYMSPEQATGDQQVGPGADIYALGCVLYEILVGEPPFTGSTAQAILGKIVTGDADPLTQHRRAVPANVDAAVRKALEKVPADRFRSAQDFAAALGAPTFRYGEVGAASVGATRSGWKPLALVTTLTTIVLAALLVRAFASPEAPGPVSRYSIALPPGHDVGDFRGSNLAVSPDGSHIAYVGPGPDDAPMIWVQRRDQLDPLSLPGTEGAINPVFSPDGERIAFGTVDAASIKAVSLDGARPVTVTSVRVNLGLWWGADDHIYHGGDGIFRTPHTGGEAERLTELVDSVREVLHLWPQLLPGGRGLLFVTMKAGSVPVDFEIAAADFDSGTHKVILRGVFARYLPSGHLLFLDADGTLRAVPFDVGRLEVTGTPIVLADGVAIPVAQAPKIAVSEAGRVLYLTGINEQDQELVWVTRDGVATPVDSDWVAAFQSPAISPDGTRMALELREGESDIWVMRLASGTRQRLTLGEEYEQNPSWTPDGMSVTYALRSATTSELSQLWTRRADASAPAERALTADVSIAGAVWAPGGAWLVYRTSAGFEGQDYGIYAIRPASDSVPTALVAGARAQTLSPDGRWMVYSSNESGQDEIYVVPFPNSGDGKFIVSANGGREPRWSRGGGEIFYRASDGFMVAAEVSTDPTFALGERRVLFDARPYRAYVWHSQYDVTEDDQRFVMIRPATKPGSGRLIVVENLLAELRERMGSD